MISRYRTTPLEDWVTAFYKSVGINKPEDIQMKSIANHCSISLMMEKTESYYFNSDYVRLIVLDSRLSRIQQREAFFHELCHILRHEGIQGIMPPLFREWQEWDAANFTKYAAIPSHMLQYIRLDSNRDIVADMVGVFRVTPELCAERLKQIQGRLLVSTSG